jgi:hypothetical protein
MSTITAEELVKAGYTNIWEAGWRDGSWDNAGCELPRSRVNLERP